MKANNSFGLPCKVTHYVEICSVADLQDALIISHANDVLPIPLGEASNVILPRDWNCLCLKIAIPGVQILEKTKKDVLLEVMAGENWHRLTEYCVNNEFFGLENLALIPGSVGAAPIQNIGAYGRELKDFLVSVQAVEITSGAMYSFSASECELSYRSSKFKHQWRDKFIITSVTMKLSTEAKVNLTYERLRAELSREKNNDSLNVIPPNVPPPNVPPPNVPPLNDITPLDVFNAVVRLRKRTLPNPEVMGNVGSFFHNPTVSNEVFSKIKQEFPKVMGFALADNQVRLAAASLLEICGFKGYGYGKVSMSEQHALCMVNLGGAQQEDVIALADEIQAKVLSKFGISLTTEPRIYL